MLRNKGGFSLIEVISVLGIILILSGGVLSFFISNQKTYTSGSKQINLHTDLRFAAERMSRALRYAWNISFLDENFWDPVTADTTYHNYIFFDPGTRTIMMKDESGIYPISEAVITELNYSAKGSTLLFALTGTDGNTTYALESSVKPLNYNGKIQILVTPVALRFARDAAGVLGSPEEPDPGGEAPEIPTYIEHWTTSFPGTVTFPKKSGKNQAYTETKILFTSSSRSGTTKDIDFSFARSILGNAQGNTNFSGKWELYIESSNRQIIRQEDIKVPIGREIIQATIKDLSIPPSQPITIGLYITYNTGGNSKNNIEPIFEFLDVQATMTNNP